MPKLHARRRADQNQLLIAMPQVESPETLDGLVVPVDPDRICRMPGITRPADFALTVALTGLVLLGWASCKASDLARICGLAETDLGIALTRAQGRKSDGSPKYFRAAVGADGNVIVAPIMRRIMRPDRYVRLSVEVLASAPDSAHARLYVLAAEAAMGDETQGKNCASMSLSALGLQRASDPQAVLAEMVSWVQPRFGNAVVGRIISGEICDDTVFVHSASSSNWSYDHRATPRPWTDDDYWQSSRLRERDGRWDGRELSLDPVRAAKVCEWVRKRGCRISTRSIRQQWLYALRQALGGSDSAAARRQILGMIAEHDADTAFERWVIANAVSLSEPNQEIRLYGEEACALRRVAASDPRARGLTPYATDPMTGESLCYLQYRWRVADPIVAAFHAGQLSRREFAQSLVRQKAFYRVGGREPTAPTARKAPPLGRQRLEAMTRWLIERQCQLPAFWQAPAELAQAVTIHAMSGSGGHETVTAFLDATLNEVAEGSRLKPWRNAWRGGLVEAAADGGGLKGCTLEEAARQLLADAVRATG